MDLRRFKNGNVLESIRKGIGVLRDGINVIGNVNRARDFDGKFEKIDDALWYTVYWMMRKVDQMRREEKFST